MPSSTIDAVAYDGSLLSLDLLSGSQTLVLSSFGSTTSGTFTNDNAVFDSNDDGVATFNGEPVTYIGSGTATPGVEVLGIVVPLGTSKDIVAFEAGGQIYFVYPDGPPNLLSAVAVVIDLSPAPYSDFTPVCFGAGTLILTPSGERAVETLQPGDFVLDIEGSPQEIKWIGKKTIPLRDITCHETRKRLAPICIHANAFGPGRPHTDLYVSPQHRILIEGHAVELLLGMDETLCPAKSFIGHQASQHLDAKEVTYYHILCDTHSVIHSNGLATETLLLGQVGLRSLTPDDIAEILAIFPEFKDLDAGYVLPAYALATNREARLLSCTVI